MPVQSLSFSACGQSACQLFFVSLPTLIDSLFLICHMLRHNENGSAGCSTHLAEPNPQSEVIHDGS
jgi:hypothetical protein